MFPGTTGVQIYECVSQTDQRLFLIDTPGFDDTYRSDTAVLREIAGWLQQSYENKILLSGIIYLHRILDVRMRGTDRKNLRMFKKLCGEDNLSSVVLASTMWDGVDEKTGCIRENELRSSFWATMVEKGSKVVRHDGGVDSAERIVNHILSRQQTITLDIQRELVHDGKQLQDTAAGAAVQAELNEKIDRLQKDLLEVRQSFRETAASHHQEREDLRVEYREISELLQQTSEDKEKLAADRDELRRQMKEQSRKFQADSKARELMHRTALAHQMEIQDLNHKLENREKKLDTLRRAHATDLLCVMM